MSKYHYLIAGLPDITLDDSKQVYSVSGFKEEIFKKLSRGDKKLMNLFFLKYDNQNLLNWLKDPLNTDAAVTDDRGTISAAKFIALVDEFKEKGLAKSVRKELPLYILTFLKEYAESLNQTNKEEGDQDIDLANKDDEDPENDEKEQEKQPVTPDDKLTALYYAYAMKNGNKFFAAWFELNLTIKNILTAVTCRKHGLDRNLYIIGNDKIAVNLKTSSARDFNLGDDVEFLADLLKLAEETDLVSREKRIDVLKWEWLDNNTIFKVFDVESIFSYLLKIEMIERWTNLDRASGEATFRELISAMKKDSNTALDEFKKKNNK